MTSGNGPLPRIIERLKGDHRFADALGFLLGRAVPDDRSTKIRCLRPERHNNGDANPSMVIEPDVGWVECPVCGLSLGLLELGVERGLAGTKAEVAALLEERFYGPPSRNVRPAPERSVVSAAERATDAPETPAANWPLLPETAASLGWTLVEHGGRTCYRIVVCDASGTPCRVKYRGPRDAAGDVYVRSEPTDDRRNEEGLVGETDRLAQADPGMRVLVVEGETCLLRAVQAARDESVEIIVVSPSNGAGHIGATGGAFRGLRVVVAQDADPAGRKGADSIVRLLRGSGAAEVTDLDPARLGAHDVREYLDGGGTLANLLEVASEPAPSPSDATTPDALPRIYSAAEIDAMVLPPKDVIVADLMMRGNRALLYGNEGSGKTIFAMRLALALGGGVHRALIDPGDRKHALFEVVAGPLPVLYVVGSSEDDFQRIQARQRVIAADLCIDLATARVQWVSLPPAFDPFDTAGAARMLRTIEQAKIQGGVLVIDNLFAVSGGDLSDQQFTANVWSRTAEWRTAFDLAGELIIAHPRKSGTGDDRGSADTMYGSKRSLAAAESVIEFVKDGATLDHEAGAPRKVEMRWHKLRDAPDGYARTVYLDGAAGVFTHRSPEDDRPAPGNVTPYVLYLALRKYAAASPLVGWEKVFSAVTATLTRGRPEGTKSPSPTTVRRAVQQIALEPPEWLHEARSGQGPNAQIVLALANADGSPWVESDGTPPPAKPTDEEARR